MFLFVFWIVNFGIPQIFHIHNQKCSLTSKRLRTTAIDCRRRKFVHRCYQLQRNDQYESNVNHAPLCRSSRFFRGVTAKKSASEVSSARKSRRVLSHIRAYVCTHTGRAHVHVST